MLVVPNAHVENIYDITDEILGGVHALSKKIAVAIRSTYNCSGTSMRQHNEPDGGQDVWHFHVHVFPRYEDDELYKSDDTAEIVEAEDREPYARKLRDFLDSAE